MKKLLILLAIVSLQTNGCFLFKNEKTAAPCTDCDDLPRQEDNTSAGSDFLNDTHNNKTPEQVNQNTFIQEQIGAYTYKTVVINGQTIMAENMRSPKTDNANGIYAPNGDEANVEQYGHLYSWEAAQKVCPSGWHLPTKKEFKAILEYVGHDDARRAQNLRITSWDNGKDRNGFGALPAGGYFKESYYYFASHADFWSSTAASTSSAYRLHIESSEASMIFHFKECGYSVRCIKD